MATIVIVPAAYHGGWVWKTVRAELQAAGHAVSTPTLTGLGERRHLATPDIGLDTHIQDIVNVLEYEDLRDVVLVGHSYGGMVLTAVADRVADRLARLVYLDALLPLDGESTFDLLPGLRADWEERSREFGAGWRVPHPDDPDGGGDGDWEWWDWRYAPQPLKSGQQPVRLTGTGGRAVPGVYIRCTAWPGAKNLARFADRARERGWPVHELATGHSPLNLDTERTALVDLLLRIV
jgi:pimeloyl-ACP methyl ester carboxylesterase